MRYAILLLALYTCSVQAADPLLVAQIVVCESGSRPDVCGDDGVSCGIAQFRKETFYEFAKLAGLKNPNWMDFRQQVYLLHWGIDHGHGRRWTCFRKLSRKIK